MGETTPTTLPLGMKRVFLPISARLLCMIDFGTMSSAGIKGMNLSKRVLQKDNQSLHGIFRGLSRGELARVEGFVFKSIHRSR
jgi:hypothetical protein